MEIFINISLTIMIVLSAITIIGPFIYLIYTTYNNDFETSEAVWCVFLSFVGAVTMFLISSLTTLDDCEKQMLKDEEVYICNIEKND